MTHCFLEPLNDPSDPHCLCIVLKSANDHHTSNTSTSILSFRKFRPLGTIQERTADVSTCTTSATGTQTVFNSGPDQDLGHEDEEIEDSHKDEELQDNHEDQELQHATNDAVSGTRCIIIKMH